MGNLANNSSRESRDNLSNKLVLSVTESSILEMGFLETLILGS